ncbi:hypothetical protein [Rhodanobacter sp. KK11]|uniref:hypothetical protein n=1 Tax=Rhodanobacter sp. KK11 TaxID=3083255 RepID=UPI0029676652|nr:hypothetical protein [Rhodanobacter sp. KK11]MDW2980856.1 hypothetical protein [Rhodanobacter sp. KK11]
MGAPLASPVLAQDFSPAAVEMFHGLRQQPNDLARYVYLVKTLQELPVADRPLAMQMFASVENELGLYNEALRDFPLKSHVAADTAIPTAAQWKAADAVDVIVRQAADRRIVLINEAHHDAHTRQLTLALLPRLRALGFDYFAAEALLDKDASLMKRGYPIRTSGSEYLREPSYGEIVRTAIKLGFKVVSYDMDSRSTQEREAGQARNLYRKVFAKDPDARLFVHAGYAHIDKAKGRLGNTVPMAMQLQQLTGIEPLSIDQTQFREQVPSEPDAYTELVRNFPSKDPFVLLDRTTGKPWSAHPEQYDINVLLPPAAGQRAVESGYTQPSTIVHDMIRSQPMLAHFVNTQRPEWLTLHDERFPYTVSTTLCRVTTPCVVDAHYLDEDEDAVAADRYAFMQGDTVSKLYLRPGRYRLRAWDIRGRTLSEQVITVNKR